MHSDVIHCLLPSPISMDMIKEIWTQGCRYEPWKPPAHQEEPFEIVHSQFHCSFLKRTLAFRREAQLYPPFPAVTLPPTWEPQLSLQYKTPPRLPALAPVHLSNFIYYLSSMQTLQELYTLSKLGFVCHPHMPMFFLPLSSCYTLLSPWNALLLSIGYQNMVVCLSNATFSVRFFLSSHWRNDSQLNLPGICFEQDLLQYRTGSLFKLTSAKQEICWPKKLETLDLAWSRCLYIKRNITVSFWAGCVTKQALYQEVAGVTSWALHSYQWKELLFPDISNKCPKTAPQQRNLSLVPILEPITTGIEGGGRSDWLSPCDVGPCTPGGGDSPTYTMKPGREEWVTRQENQDAVTKEKKN